MRSPSENLKFYYDRMSELYRLECIRALLGWDQRVFMPPLGAKARADQLEYLSLAVHQKATDSEFIRVVDELFESLDTLSPDDQVNIRESKREIDIERKLPEDFVSEMSQVRALSYNVWVKARPEDDFKAVQPFLEKIVELSKRRCELTGYEENPYDALLDLYEPGAKTSQVKPLLLHLADELKQIIPPISEQFEGLEEFQGHYDQNTQLQLCRQVAGNLGFGFDSGRIDTTAHPFMTTLGPSDHRITTRFNEDNFLPALYSTIHETGHALYELGLPTEWAGTPRGSAVSLGIHESQSRMWENLVGRSESFTGYLSGVIRNFFPEESDLLDPQGLWKQANRVEPSLIRTEADEVTYSQHIVIRMLIEEALINGELSVSDLPTAWSDLYEKYLGIRPTDYKNGVMQDVHWYSGSIGYFPTYALGNLYGAMMMESAASAIPDLSSQLERGEFSPLLSWLRENVHRYGMTYRGPELIRKITGKELSDEAFVGYLKRKFLGVSEQH